MIYPIHSLHIKYFSTILNVKKNFRIDTLNLTQELFEVIGFRNVDMAELRIHTPAERVAIAEGHLFRVAFAIFFQLSQAAEFQGVPLFPGVFFPPG
ncbi:hypothetical protein ACVQU0_004867, partial [Escherichia coli]